MKIAVGRTAAAAGRSRKRLWVLSGLLLVCLAVCLALLENYYSDRWFLDAEKKQIAVVEAAGIAATLEAYKAKYPSSERGREGVAEVVRIFSAMRAEPKDLVSKKPSRMADGNVPFSGPEWVKRYLGSNDYTTESLIVCSDINSTPIEALLTLHEKCRIEELGWTYASFAEQSVYFKQGFHARQVTRVLLPTAVWLAVADSDTTRAYTLLLNWMYLPEFFKVATTSMMEGMIGVALDGICFDVCSKLMSSVPVPSEEIAARLYDQLDPQRARKNLLRTCEAEVIWTAQTIKCRIGLEKTGGYRLKNFNRHFDEELSKQLEEKFATFRKDLSGLRLPSTFPGPADLFSKNESYVRRTLCGVILSSLEWLPLNYSTVNSDSLPALLSRCERIQEWRDKKSAGNPVANVALPGYNRAMMNERGREAEAAVLQAECMMQIARLRSNATSTMPRTLHELSERSGKPVPLDPLAAKPGDSIQYQPDEQTGTYKFTHNPSVYPHGGYPAMEFLGSWR
ncbi:MAG: hypothetical protein ACR2IE_10320 [Candidatus Sumerlaeaceae bacterium]